MLALHWSIARVSYSRASGRGKKYARGTVILERVWEARAVTRGGESGIAEHRAMYRLT